MSGGFPFGFEVSNAHDQGSATATSSGTQVAGGSGSKGSWVQLVASSAIDAAWAVVTITRPTGTFGRVTSAIDIGIGPSGSEVPIVSNLLMSANGFNISPCANRFAFPVCIPAGTRIAARAQNNTTTNSTSVQIELFDSSFSSEDFGSGVCDSYGFVSASTQGTTVDPGATLNTKGSYAQIAASTTNDLAGFFLMFDILNDSGSDTTGAILMLVDLAIGAAGSEIVIVPNIPLLNQRNQSNDVDIVLPQLTEIIWVPIPSGTRIAARAQANNTTTPQRTIGVSLEGIRA